METSAIYRYITNRFYIGIILICLTALFYFLIPEIGVKKFIIEISEIRDRDDLYLEIVNILSKKQQNIYLFIEIFKVIFSAIVAAILLFFTYITVLNKELFEGHQKSQIELKEIKSIFDSQVSDSVKREKIICSEIDGAKVEIGNMNILLSDYLAETKILLEYSQHGAVIHNNFNEALQYDIDKVKSLEESDLFFSTVIFNDDSLNFIENNISYQYYINELKYAAIRGVKVERVYIVKGKPNNEQIKHFDELHKSNIKIKIVSFLKLHSIDPDLSRNFVIISNKEVAFAYPFEGDFKYAINLEKKDRAAIYYDRYRSLFEKISGSAVEFNGVDV